MRFPHVRPFVALLVIGCLALAPIGLAEEDEFDEPDLDDSADTEVSFGDQIDKVLTNPESDDVVNEVKTVMLDLCRRFPLPY